MNTLYYGDNLEILEKVVGVRDGADYGTYNPAGRTGFRTSPE